MAGIEISEAMLKRGKKKFGNLIFQRKVDIREGSVSKIPFGYDLFDKVSTVNTIFFWPDLAAGNDIPGCAGNLFAGMSKVLFVLAHRWEMFKASYRLHPFSH